jgi:hypothetical protein
MKRRTHDLPKFVQPYLNGKYRVYIARKHLKYAKAGFDTPQSAHEHALEILEQAAETVMASCTHQKSSDRVLESVQKAAIGYECEGCGYSQPEQFSKCLKCGGYQVRKETGKVDTEQVLAEHFPESKQFRLAESAPSCENCIHIAVCRMKYDHECKVLESLQQFYSKMDAGMVQQIIGFYCEHYRRKG